LIILNIKIQKFLILHCNLKEGKMEKRPISITIIAWFLIVSSGFSLIISLANFNNPMVKELMAKSLLPLPIQYAMMYIGLLVVLGSGIGMLKKQNWARLLYVIWIAAGFLINLFTSPIKTALIPGLLFFIIIVFFVFRPAANQYFSKA